MKSTFGKRLLKLRKNSQITRSELAAILNVSRSTIRNWECDKSEPKNRTDTILKISDIFLVSTDYVIGRDVLENLSYCKYMACTADYDEYQKSLHIKFFPLFFEYLKKKDTHRKFIPPAIHVYRKGEGIEMALKQVLSNDERICVSRESIKSMIPMLQSPESYDFVLLAVRYMLLDEKKQKEEKRDSLCAVK